MRESRTRILQGLWLMLAAAMFAAAGLLQTPLDRFSRDAGLVTPGNVAVRQDPKMLLLTVLPGGLRAPIIGFLWIQAEELQNAGKDYDAYQKAKFICALQPHFSGAWVFQAWNMSYNISVKAHTLEHRWLWVYNGIQLLRDEGIPANPQSITLYGELAWIYFHKIGGFMDDFHEGYKRRWAAYMQHLLAPPPYGTTEEMIAAFRPIAEAPLDHDPARQGRELIQRGSLAEVLKDPDCAEYARLLGQRGVAVDRSLLDAYNRDSQDEALRAVRSPRAPPADPNDPAAKEVFDLINSRPHAQARGRLLAFVRAQLLWNQYRLDPSWMLALMEKYGPLDWRLPWSHAIYWATYGFHAAQGTPMESIDKIEGLNASRFTLFGLKDLTWQGRVTYEEDPEDPDLPRVYLFADPRFVDRTQQEYVRLIEKAKQDRPNEAVEDNAFRAGHMNYLSMAIQMLYVQGRHAEARKYLQYLKDTYRFKGGEWELDLDEFVVYRFSTDPEPGRETAQSQVPEAIQTAYVLALQNDSSGARAMIRHAQRIYELYQRSVPDKERLGLKPLLTIEADALFWLLVRPRAVGYNLSLQSRVQLWRMADPRLQALIYPRIAPSLRLECQAENLNFDEIFPFPR